MVSNYETDVALYSRGRLPSSADWRHWIFSFDLGISEHTQGCKELLEDTCNGHGRIHGHSHHRESSQALVRIQRLRIVQHSYLDLSLTRALLRVYTVRDHGRISTVGQLVAEYLEFLLGYTQTEMSHRFAKKACDLCFCRQGKLRD